MSDWTPETNRIHTDMLTPDERIALGAAKHGWLFWNDSAKAWQDKITNDGCLYPGSIYRAKPAPAPTLSITVNGVTNMVAAPLSTEPSRRQQVWLVAPFSSEWAVDLFWCGDLIDMHRLKHGQLHLTKPAARAHAMAMVGLKAEGV